MKINYFFRVLIIFCSINLQVYSQNQPQHNKKVIGYYAQWAIYGRDYNVLDIEGDKLTHIMYAFYDAQYDATTNIARIKSLDEYADYQHNESGMHKYDAPVKGNIGDLKLLKERYPHLKVLISVGGWTKSQNFPAIAANQKARETFAQSMVDFMNAYTWIDGFDVDWEFPLYGGTDGKETINGRLVPAQPHNPNDHKNLVYLLKEIRETFDSNGMTDKDISISMGNTVINVASQFIGPNNQAANNMSENIMDFCDFVTFFGYDFGGNWYDKTCYNAPLFGGGNTNDPLHNPSGRNQVLSELIDVYLTDVGIPANKLVVGLPFYGKLFEGVASSGIDSNNPGLYKAAPRTNNTACNSPQPPQGTWDAVNCENSGAIDFSDLSQGKGTNVHHYLDTNNPLSVSASATSDGWVRHWDDVAKVPYLYNATQNKFISYDDKESIDLKVKYALSKELAGVMIWELSQDARNSDNGLLDVVDLSIQNENYDITLNFKTPNQSPIQGVTVKLKDENDTVLETLTSDSNGQVIFSDKTSYSFYGISYTYSSYSFLPSNVVFNTLDFDSDKVLNITGSNEVHSIQGSVKENGQLLSNIYVILNDSNGQELQKITSTDGNFIFNSVISGFDYSLVAEKGFYSSSTLTYTNLSSNQTNQEITATRNSFTILGRVSKGSGGIQEATVTITGNGQTYTKKTNSDGDYTISNIPAGYNYVVTPSFNSFIFNPISTRFNLLNSNITANFQENLGLIYGTVKKGSTPVANATVSLILPWADNSHGYKKIKKTTNSQGEYFYTATELEGYNTISSLKLGKWENNNVVYHPTTLASISITTTPKEFNFNSQPVKPQVSINYPNTANLGMSYGSDVNLEALVELSYDDSNTALSRVLFKVDGVTVANSNNQNIYSASWSPADSDYGATHTFTIEAESSNGESVGKEFEFTLNCTGVNCPNIAPNIVWNSPNNKVINQNQGFQNIPIEVTVTDSDGTVSTVSITIDGNTVAMTSGTDNTYTYSFTPSNHQEYPVIITAIDNERKSTAHTATLNIIDSQFVPLPSGNIILGYAHSWENASAPFMYFNQMVSTNYNVVMYSFIETVGQNGYTPQLTINSNRYQTNGVFDSQLLKNDINSLRDRGIPVIVSIGGQNGHVELNTIAEKDEFVQGLKNIIDKYGFDGIDLDFEGGSMNFGAGTLTDFSYSGISAFPKLKNVVDAFKEIKQHYGSNFILTCAPETFYVQVGRSTYSNTAGAFLPVIHNLRDELDLVMVQLYNTGSIIALDGQAYNQAMPDFLTSMSDMLITGFDVASTGFHFSGLPASKIMVGIPSCPAAAPAGGYIQSVEAKKALNYLRFKKEFSGRNYALRGNAHPNLRGVMTWSVNWDRASNCASEYEFSNSYYNYFNETLSLSNNYTDTLIDIYPNPVGDILTIKTNKKLSSVKIFNLIGKLIFSKNYFQGSNNIIDLSDLKTGFYILKMKVNSKEIVRKLIKE